MSTADEEEGFVQCKTVTIFFCETWGDQHYLGVTGLEVLGDTFEKIPLEMHMLSADPQVSHYTTLAKFCEFLKRKMLLIIVGFVCHVPATPCSWRDKTTCWL